MPCSVWFLRVPSAGRQEDQQRVWAQSGPNPPASSVMLSFDLWTLAGYRQNNPVFRIKKKPWPYLWLHFSVPGLLRYNLHNSNLFSFSLQFFEFRKMHRVTHCHTIKIVNTPVTPSPFVRRVCSFPPPELTPSSWQPLI